MAHRGFLQQLADTRVVSALEVAIGAFLVIGHNVYGILPNEVPLLFVMALASARLRGGWATLGFSRPASWRRIVLIALAAAAVRIALGDLVIDPLTSRFWPPATAPAGIETITGNLPMALLALLVVWGFAAFGEEIGYRGYLLGRAADLGGRSTPAWWAAMLFVSVLFGLGHYYKGPSGMVDSGVAGLILGTAYLLAGRNLWVPVLGHGFIDTVGVILVYSGLDS